MPKWSRILEYKIFSESVIPAIIEFNRRVLFQRKTVVMVWKCVDVE